MITNRQDWRVATACAGLALAFGTTPANAAPPAPYAPSSFAFGSGLGTNGNQSTTQIKNGVVGTTFGNGVATTASADGWTNTATVITDIGNSTAARADLRTGTAKAVAVNGGINTPRGIAEARIQDSVFFNNVSGGTVYLPFSYRFDGSLTDSIGGTASAIFRLDEARVCTDLSYTSCGNSLTLQNGGNANNTTVIGYLGNGSQNGVQQGGAFFFGAPDNVDLANYSVFKDWNTLTGSYDTIVASVLALPTGASRLGFDLRLKVDCWVDLNARCDFGHTSAFRFGALPTGLSFTSASGVFLAGDPAIVGVPEPASWALLIAGFGLVGATLRKRRTVAA